MVVAGSLWAWTGCGSNVGSACSEHHAGCHHIAVGTGYASRRSTTACSSSTRPGEEVSGGFGEDDAPKSPLKRFHPAQLRKEIAAAVVCGDTGALSALLASAAGTWDPECCLDQATGDTALHLAARYGHLAVAKLLLKHGSGGAILNKRGLSPAAEAYKKGFRGLGDLITGRVEMIDASHGRSMGSINQPPKRREASILREHNHQGAESTRTTTATSSSCDVGNQQPRGSMGFERSRRAAGPGGEGNGEKRGCIGSGKSSDFKERYEAVLAGSMNPKVDGGGVDSSKGLDAYLLQSCKSRTASTRRSGGSSEDGALRRSMAEGGRSNKMSSQRERRGISNERLPCHSRSSSPSKHVIGPRWPDRNRSAQVARRRRLRASMGGWGAVVRATRGLKLLPGYGGRQCVDCYADAKVCGSCSKRGKQPGGRAVFRLGGWGTLEEQVQEVVRLSGKLRLGKGCTMAAGAAVLELRWRGVCVGVLRWMRGVCSLRRAANHMSRLRPMRVAAGAWRRRMVRIKRLVSAEEMARKATIRRVMLVAFSAWRYTTYLSFLGHVALPQRRLMSVVECWRGEVLSRRLITKMCLRSWRDVVSSPSRRKWKQVKLKAEGKLLAHAKASLWLCFVEWHFTRCISVYELRSRQAYALQWMISAVNAARGPRIVALAFRGASLGRRFAAEWHRVAASSARLGLIRDRASRVGIPRYFRCFRNVCTWHRAERERIELAGEEVSRRRWNSAGAEAVARWRAWVAAVRVARTARRVGGDARQTRALQAWQRTVVSSQASLVCVGRSFEGWAAVSVVDRGAVEAAEKQVRIRRREACLLWALSAMAEYLVRHVRLRTLTEAGLDVRRGRVLGKGWKGWTWYVAKVRQQVMRFRLAGVWGRRRVLVQGMAGWREGVQWSAGHEANGSEEGSTRGMFDPEAGSVGYSRLASDKESQAGNGLGSSQR